MRKILHLSDIHFGKTDREIIESLLHACLRIRPDLVVISGDLTQRALISEFKEAQQFLERLRAARLPIFAIPGNHDIRPLYAPFKRLRNAYDRYNDFITHLASDRFVDEEIVVSGLNTVRASRLKDGRLSSLDIENTKKWFMTQPHTTIRILVTHHPLDLPIEISRRKLASQASQGILGFAEAQVDVYLSGHYHRSSAISTKTRYSKTSHGAIAAQAGTISTRKRGEPQSFSLLEIQRTEISVTPYFWGTAQKEFLSTASIEFSFRDNQWIRLDEKNVVT